jgi:3-phosphoshikimate 1-carboxyvinyltransferase
MSSEKFLLTHTTKQVSGEIKLPASKSEANRALIINALTGNKSILENLSEARDTQTMQRLLNSSEHTLDVIDAGTTMRFLTAFTALTNQDKILTGTPRMQERPIKILTEALKKLGANIEYLNNEGFPPIHVKGFTYSGIKELEIQGDVSSQYISALLMVAPLLPEGLTLKLTGIVGSRPYIEMTLQQMSAFGISWSWTGNEIHVPHGEYKPITYQVESDWSGASYWYSIAALSDQADIHLLGLKQNSLQGDSKIAKIMEVLGVHSVFTDKGVKLSKTEPFEEIEIDFADCPDLAQTVAVICAAKGIVLKMTGVESLKIKETDRIYALQTELAKCGASLQESDTQPGLYTVRQAMPFTQIRRTVEINTYDDHRMAMAFAPLALLKEIIIENPGVVVKSYPRYWHDLQKTGFEIMKVESTVL